MGAWGDPVFTLFLGESCFGGRHLTLGSDAMRAFQSTAVVGSPVRAQVRDGVGGHWVCEAPSLRAGPPLETTFADAKSLLLYHLLLVACCFRSLFSFSVPYMLLRSFLNFPSFLLELGGAELCVLVQFG